jgi:hypothetical protein
VIVDKRERARVGSACAGQTGTSGLRPGPHAGAAITGFGRSPLAFVPEVPTCCRAFLESCSYPAWCHWIGRQNSSHLRLDRTYFQACLAHQHRCLEFRWFAQ